MNNKLSELTVIIVTFKTDETILKNCLSSIDPKVKVIIVENSNQFQNKDEIEKLLQPFYRAGNQMHTQGFGLGLSIALKAIHKHGGQLHMTSPSDGGLSVEVTLPKNVAPRD